jgi:hypothetical protein
MIPTVREADDKAAYVDGNSSVGPHYLTHQVAGELQFTPRAPQ